MVPLIVVHRQDGDGIQTAQGWSGYQGARRPVVDGMVPRKGSAKAPFLVPGDARLHEMVMGVSGEQERALDWGCNGQTVRVGSGGAIAPDRVQRRCDGGIQPA